MTRDQAEEVLLDAGWLGIMFRDLPAKRVVACAEIEMIENPDLVDYKNGRDERGCG
jgi:hypothetical protein